MKKVTQLLFATSTLLCTSAFAQTCYDGLTETTPETRFVISGSGMVEDSVTGLMWLRCSHGQTWNASSSTCSGSGVKVTWQDALQLSPEINEGGFDDWRLPNIKELATIVEKRCVDPAVNQTIFPASLAENYWSATTVAGNPESAWSVALYNGRNNTKEKQLDLHIRFVRYVK